MGGNPLQNSHNFVVESKFSNHMVERWAVENLIWINMCKFGLRGGGAEIYLYKPIFEGRRNKYFQNCWNQKYLSTILLFSWEYFSEDFQKIDFNKLAGQKIYLNKVPFTYLPSRKTSLPGCSFVFQTEQVPKLPSLEKPNNPSFFPFPRFWT